MTEELYEHLWFFVKNRKAEIIETKSDDSPEVIAWNLYLAEGEKPIPHATASEYRIVQRCILDALA